MKDPFVGAAAIALDPIPTYRGLSDVKDRWAEFVKSCEDKKSLSTVLARLAPSEIYGSAIRVYVPEESTLSLLKRYHVGLTEKLQSVYGLEMRLEFTLGAPPAEMTKSGGETPKTDHPFLKGLVDLLGASPL
jgi:hypothetical protein